MSDHQQEPDRIAFTVAEGPNTNGLADMTAAAHVKPDDAPPAPIASEPAITTGTRDIEPSMPHTQEG